VDRYYRWQKKAPPLGAKAMSAVKRARKVTVRATLSFMVD
jgi:hypothetical protein